MVNKKKKFHLSIGDLADVEVQTFNGETVGNFADDDVERALGVAIWNVQHEAWDKAIVAFEKDGAVFEVCIEPVFTKDMNGSERPFEVQLKYTLDNATQVTEMVSYDEVVKTKVTSRLFT
jgi:nitrous oxidase accessory protein NosD